MPQALLILYTAALLIGGYFLMGRLSDYLRRNNNREENPSGRRKEKQKKIGAKQEHPWYNTNDNP